jgi:hypothetical protein
VIGGPKEEMILLEPQLKALDLIIKTVPMSVLSHHKLLDSVYHLYDHKIGSMRKGKMEYPVVSCLDGLPYTEEEIQLKLGKLLTLPVMFQEAVHFLRKEETSVWVELGPRPYLKFLLKDNGIEKNVFNMLDCQEDCLLSDLMNCERRDQASREMIERALLESVARKNLNPIFSPDYDYRVTSHAHALNKLIEEFDPKAPPSWKEVRGLMQDILLLKKCPESEIKHIEDIIQRTWDPPIRE